MGALLIVFLFAFSSFPTQSTGALRAYFSLDDFSGNISLNAPSSYCDITKPSIETRGPTTTLGTRAQFGGTVETPGFGDVLVTSNFGVASPENVGQVSFTAWLNGDLNTSIAFPVRILLEKWPLEDENPTMNLFFLFDSLSGDVLHVIRFATSSGFESWVFALTEELINLFSNRWIHYAFVMDTTEFRLYFDGILIATSGPLTNGDGLYLDLPTHDYAIGNNDPFSGSTNPQRPDTNDGKFPLMMEMDEICFFDHALSAEEVSSLANRTSALPDVAVDIVQDGSPSQIGECVAQFAAQASGDPVHYTAAITPIGSANGYSFQWSNNADGGVPFSFEENTTISFASSTSSRVDLVVDVLVDDLICRRARASISVFQEPFIQASLEAVEPVTRGEETSLTIVVGGLPEPSVVWQEFSNATTNTSQRRSATPSSAYAVVRGAGGGSYGVFSPTIHPRGFVNDTNGTATEFWTPIAGANSSTFTITPTADDDGRIIRAFVFSEYGSTVSDPITLRVVEPPSPPGDGEGNGDGQGNIAQIAGGVSGGALVAFLLCCVPVILILMCLIAILVVGAILAGLSMKRMHSITDSLKVEMGEMGAIWEIDFEELDLIEELGSGAYGTVHRGLYRECEVAIKELLPHADREAFLEEANLMKKMRAHLNVLRLYGICTGDTLCLVTEYMPGGDLHSYLRAHGRPSDETTHRMLLDVAAGMAHLMKEGIIHRDLAARNLLLTTDMTIKVADFGMSRALPNRDSKMAVESEVGPVKWMSPECLNDQIYSEKSDVYAYGITCWEVLSGGRVPYEDMNALEAARGVVLDNLRPPLPDAHPVIVEIITSCYHADPGKRPTFMQIHKKIKSNLGEQMVRRASTLTASSKMMEPRTSLSNPTDDMMTTYSELASPFATPNTSAAPTHYTGI